MKAVVYHGKKDLRVEEVADPVISEPTDAIIRVTATAMSQRSGMRSARFLM